jgi:N-acetyl-anhydromuramyl-L-alanine amidase AmpD
MVQSRLAPFVPRPRLIALIVPALLLSLATGCSARRASSMRPIFVRPAAPCPSGDCGSTVVPASPSSTSSTPSTGTTIVEPGLNGGDSASSTSPTTSVRPGASGTVTSSPADMTPPAVTAPDMTPPAVTAPEPGFTEPSDLTPVPGKGIPSDVKPVKPSGSGAGGTSNGSSVKSSQNTRPAATARPRQASLSDQVRPFVNDADDLMTPPKADRPWQYIVLHHSANDSGGYDSIDREHRKRLGWKGCGYHFVIGNGSETPDGQIEVSQRWVNQKHGVHCRDGKNPDVNEYGIGICLFGDLEKTPPTAKQIAAAHALVAYLRDRYHIPSDNTETHSHLAASPTSCPGRMFPTDRILNGSSMARHNGEALTDR